MNLDPAEFPDLESIEVTIVEETPDGKRYVTIYCSISDIPEFVPASVGSEESRLANAVDLRELIRLSVAATKGSGCGEGEPK
jgi:hypothetical protein